MNKKRSFGRFTAMSLAGLTAVSSMAIVASAEAYPSNVYEVTYTGISSTPVLYKAISAVSDNTYVKYSAQSGAEGTGAQAVFTTGFSITEDSAFKTNFYDKLLVNGATSFNSANADKSTGNWVYNSVTAYSGTATPVVPDDYINARTDASTTTATPITAAASVTFYFKTQGERTNAINTIANANQSEFSKKYKNAYDALTNDLNSALNAYNTDATALINEVSTEAKAAIAKNATAAGYTVTKSLNGSTPTINSNADLTAWLADQNAEKTKVYNELSKVATQVKAEFAEAYQASNWGFSSTYDVKSTTAADEHVFTTGSGAVAFSNHTGQFIYGVSASYTAVTTSGSIDLKDSYYRTVGAYNNANSYAFTGEIIEDTIRTDEDYLDSYLLNSDRWSQFSATIEGQTSDNQNTTEPGVTTTTTTTTTTDATTTWYPSDGTYRVVNTSGLSYLGNNGKYYTTASAANLYGGGYTGTSKSSNYSSVKSNSTLYFNADDGYYYTTASSAGSHSYIVKNETSSTTSTTYTDPYYYYYLTGTSSSSTTDPDAPTIYGSTKKSGWTKITSTINSASSGATVKISMNGTSTVPASVLAAAKTKGVNLQLVNSNGSKVTIKAGNVDTSSAINTAITYNVKSIKSSLVTAAKKVNSGTVSTAQIQVGDDGSLGGTVTATVKLSTKRAGDTVKAYRLSNGKLVREATGTVSSTGALNLNLKNGGTYLLVVIE